MTHRSPIAWPLCSVSTRRARRGGVHANALHEVCCDTDGWNDDALSDLATISFDDEADGCITRLLDRGRRRRLAADRDDPRVAA